MKNDIASDIQKIVCIILLFLLLFSVTPMISFGAEDGVYQLLAPLPGQGPSVDTSPSGFSSYLQTVLIFAIGITGIIAVGQLVVAGFFYVLSGSTGGKVDEMADAKDRINATIFGAVILIFSYIALQQINPNLLNFNFSLEPLGGGGSEKSPIQEAAESAKQNISEFGTQIASVKILPDNPISSLDAQGREIATPFDTNLHTSKSAGNEKTSRELILKNDNIKINKPSCAPGQKENCTNLAGIGETVIKKTDALQKACNCTVTVTGGTEPGHATHGEGRNTVDYRSREDDNQNSNALTKYLISKVKDGNATPVPTKIGVEIRLNNGDVFRHEYTGTSKAHWHAIYTNKPLGL